MGAERSRVAAFDATGIPLLLARAVVGLAFLILGWNKLDDPVAFLKALREYQMFPPAHPWLMNATAAALPVAEMTCGALLLLGIAVRGTAVFVIGMLLVFIVAIGSRAGGIAAEQSISFCSVAFDCGCGSGVQNACRKLLENSGLTLLAIAALLSRSHRWCLRRDLVPAARAAGST